MTILLLNGLRVYHFPVQGCLDGYLACNRVYLKAVKIIPLNDREGQQGILSLISIIGMHLK